MKSREVLGTLNSLMACSEVSTLFSSEEMDGLLHALLPAIKRDFPSELIDPEQYFVARVCQNLRVVMCLSPQSRLLNDAAQ